MAPGVLHNNEIQQKCCHQGRTGFCFPCLASAVFLIPQFLCKGSAWKPVMDQHDNWWKQRPMAFLGLRMAMAFLSFFRPSESVRTNLQATTKIVIGKIVQMVFSNETKSHVPEHDEIEGD